LYLSYNAVYNTHQITHVWVLTAATPTVLGTFA
jgi:hypothetical protein